MKILDIVEKVEGSEPFTSWEHDGYYLVHCFKMTGQDTWQVGYYHPDSEQMVSFMVQEDIEKSPESEVFKEPDSKIMELDRSTVKIDSDEALDKAMTLLQDEYSDQVPGNAFMILQMINEKATYNITYVTKQFCSVNVKISAEDGSVIGHKKMSLMDMANIEKGERHLGL